MPWMYCPGIVRSVSGLTFVLVAGSTSGGITLVSLRFVRLEGWNCDLGWSLVRPHVRWIIHFFCKWRLMFASLIVFLIQFSYFLLCMFIFFFIFILLVSPETCYRAGRVARLYGHYVPTLSSSFPISFFYIPFALLALLHLFLACFTWNLICFFSFCYLTILFASLFEFFGSFFVFFCEHNSSGRISLLLCLVFVAGVAPVFVVVRLRSSWVLDVVLEPVCDSVWRTDFPRRITGCFAGRRHGIAILVVVPCPVSWPMD